MHNITRFALALLAGLALTPAVAIASTEAPAAAHGAEPRVALVVGNANYRDEQKLANPANDASLIAASLTKVGFDVVLVTDASQKQLQRAIVDFGDRLSKAGPDATGLFYYAGHGLQVEGSNYLVPVDADITREAEVEIDAVEADLVLKQMAFAGSRVNIVILDACRNNPLARDFRGIGDSSQGFAEIHSKPKGTFISYSTAPGEVAVDGMDGHSPFAEAVADAIQIPGLDLPEVFQRVRERVLNATDEKQTPWDSSSLVKSFYFVPPQHDDLVAALQPASPPAVTQVAQVATPNHDPHHGTLLRTATADAAAVAQPVEQTADQPGMQASAFVAANRSLYAKSGSRMRAEPSTDAAVVTKLASNAPLKAIARSADGSWWQVALADGRTGYVHRQAVSEYRLAMQLPRNTIPASMTISQPTSTARRSGAGLVGQAMDWLANAAGSTGTRAPKIVRTER